MSDIKFAPPCTVHERFKACFPLLNNFYERSKVCFPYPLFSMEDWKDSILYKVLQIPYVFQRYRHDNPSYGEELLQ